MSDIAAQPLSPSPIQSTRNTHTPGPWKAKDQKTGSYDNRRNAWCVSDDEARSSISAPITLKNGEVVAFAVASTQNHFDSQDVRVDANARLIAAAPDLLAALQTLMSRLETLQDNLLAGRAARAAIEKATGASFAGSGDRKALGDAAT